ncbi:alpha/beta hydrolase [Pseudomonas mosselii]|uniref:alpha/beta fold hydrolase n=1 Tax=Pseudomonas mosselii TaxID=78327 RepID=UPI002DBED5E2|nr:alpha/beta fold hydrolase [Pseudomonas mosselii]MEB5932403.1 alpha/beta hydrolase [Pseudomonas mosselii]
MLNHKLVISLVCSLVISLSVSAHPLNQDKKTDGVNWQSCLKYEFRGWFKNKAPQELLCGYVDAPLSYSEHIQTSNVRLALTRLPARGVKKGSVVVVSGGPGLPGINPYVANDKTIGRLREYYDIIGYDPRGVGQSDPRISCDLPEHDKQPEFDESDKVSYEADVLKIITACINQTGAQVVQHIGTYEAVNDLNTIRAALGEPGLTAVAYSYGTQVAALFAERFPKQTRALVLDGVVDLSEDDYSQQLNQALGYQQTFQRFAAYCGNVHNCPLPSDEVEAVEKFRRILLDIHQKPLTTKSGRIITADDVLKSTELLLLWSEYWPDLATFLRKASLRDADEKMADMISENFGSESENALNVISCADIAMPDADRRVLRRQRTAINAAAPFRNVFAVPESPLAVCDMWPYRGKIKAHIPTPSPLLPPLLFVSQRHDPTTPYANALRMAKWFRSPVVTREGDGHTLALSGIDRCVDEAVVSYLLAPLRAAHEKNCRP